MLTLNFCIYTIVHGEETELAQVYRACQSSTAQRYRKSTNVGYQPLLPLGTRTGPLRVPTVKKFLEWFVHNFLIKNITLLVFACFF